MLIGSINNQGSIQGQINSANGVLTGVISSAGLLGGQVVGMRGFKGDKGDTGEKGADGADGQAGMDGFSPVAYVEKDGNVSTLYVTDRDGTSTTDIYDGQDGANGQDGQDGKDGQDGADGFSPSASVSKVGSVATITITDKDGTTTADVYDGSGGGASAFIAEYGVTSYSDVDDAYSTGQSIVCRYDDGDFYTHDLTFADVDIYGDYRFLGVVGYSVIEATLFSNDTWSIRDYSVASQDIATTYDKGLMSSTDKSKLDGIASGAEVNVQSDWSEADNTADDYIKNKPTIPANTSDLNNDSGFITSSSLPSNLSDLNNDMDVSDFPNDAGYITSAHEIPSGGTTGQVLAKDSNDDYDVSWVNQSGGGGSEIVYCECTDSASTVAKTATVVTGSFSSLSTGAQVAVKFTYTNTATDPTLNVNNTGAKAIMRGGTAHVGTNTNESWGAGTVVFMLYDGSVWNIVGWLNTTYTGGTGAQIITGTEALNKVWSPQQIHDGIVGLIGNPPVKVNVQTIPSTSYPQSAQTSAYSKGWTADTISGYTPVACLQASPSNYGRLSVQIALDYDNYGDRLLGFVFNPYTSALTDTILLPILYIRNDLYT